MYKAISGLTNYDMEVDRIMSILGVILQDFCLSEEVLIGHDGTKYDSYYVREV